MKKIAIIVVLALLCTIICPTLCYALPVTDSAVAQSAGENMFDQRTWQFALAGSNATGDIVYNDDGSITMTSTTTGGKFADTEEGFLFYYTEIDAMTENFTISAHFYVDNAGTKDNQSAFGVIVVDTVGARNTGRYMNYAASGCYKLTGDWSGYGVPGARFVTGYVDPMAADSMDENRESARVMDASKGFESAGRFETGYEYDFTMRKSNTGYHSTMAGDNEHEYILYGPEKLLVQDEDKVYAGFFVSRGISVTISDMHITVIAPENDEPKQEPEFDPGAIDLYSYGSKTTTSLDYNMSLKSNVAGTYTIKSNTEIYYEDIHVEAEEYCNKVIHLPEPTKLPASYSFAILFVPDEMPSFTKLMRMSISYNKFGEEGDVIYASPDVSQDGVGTKEDPVSLFSMMRYAQPGQTIIIPDGTYKLTGKINVMRGIDGREDAPITLMAETPKGVTLDCSESGITSGECLLFAGNWWRIFGFNIVGTKLENNNAKGLRISGSNNILDFCSVSNFGNSGIQISGNSRETIEMWPANNLIKNCDSYNNCDPSGQDADGFGVKLTVASGNKLYGCVAHHNIDDGFDLYAKSVTGPIGKVIIENCIAYANGFTLDNNNMTGEGNGFKLGGESQVGDHELINCISFGNGAKGITSNSGPNCIVKNCISFNNGVIKPDTESFSLYTHNPYTVTAYVVEGLISFNDSNALNNGKEDKFALQEQEPVFSTNNYCWNGTASVNINNEAVQLNWFESLNTTIAPTRNADGTIDMHGLLVLTSDAPADAGARIVTTGEEAISSQATYQPDDQGDKEEDKEEGDGGGGGCATIAPTSNMSGGLGGLIGMVSALLLAMFALLTAKQRKTSK